MPNDNELFSLLIDDPEKGLKKIMHSYMGFVYTIVHGKLSGVCSKQDIDECVSDVFYKIYKTRALIDSEMGSLKSYIAVLSKRTAIDFYRKLQKHAADISLDSFEHDFIPSGTDVEESVIDNEIADTLIQEINNLGEPDNQIMIRKYYYGESSKTISKALGLNENTVKQKASRALGKLRQVLGGVL